MKATHFRFFTLILLSFVFTLTACKDDDEEPSNSLALNGENTPLVKGFVRQSESSEGSSFAVTLTSAQLTADTDSECINTSGTGTLVLFVLGTAIAEESSLPVGTYTSAEGLFVDVINYGPGVFESAFAPSSASVTVSKSWDVYTFDFTISYT